MESKIICIYFTNYSKRESGQLNTQIVGKLCRSLNTLKCRYFEHDGGAIDKSLCSGKSDMVLGSNSRVKKVENEWRYSQTNIKRMHSYFAVWVIILKYAYEPSFYWHNYTPLLDGFWEVVILKFLNFRYKFGSTHMLHVSPERFKNDPNACPNQPALLTVGIKKSLLKIWELD